MTGRQPWRGDDEETDQGTVLAPKLPPRHLELALLESLDELGLALAVRPPLDGGGSEDAQPLETIADAPNLDFVRSNER